MKFHFVYSKEEIREAVKMETSYIAERQTDLSYEQRTDGSNNLFEVLHIFDEHYEELYKRYLDEACADLMILIPAGNIADGPPDPPENSTIISLDIENYPTGLISALRVKIRQYIIERILWLWFRAKLPHLAKMFEAALEVTKSEISKLLSRRTKLMKRIPNFP